MRSDRAAVSISHHNFVIAVGKVGYRRLTRATGIREEVREDGCEREKVCGGGETMLRYLFGGMGVGER